MVFFHYRPYVIFYLLYYGFKRGRSSTLRAKQCSLSLTDNTASIITNIKRFQDFNCSEFKTTVNLLCLWTEEMLTSNFPANKMA